MVPTATGILARIVAHKRDELRSASQRRPELEKRAADRVKARDFHRALTAHPPAIIAEIKQASPSKGVLAEHFEPGAIASSYAAGGAAALSVLTDREFFQGSLSDLVSARAACSIPVLRKDFTIDEFQVIEA